MKTNMEKSLEKLVLKYPNWNSLTDQQQEDVSWVAMQIPERCEDIAEVYINHGNSMYGLIKYYNRRYGYIINYPEPKIRTEDEIVRDFIRDSQESMAEFRKNHPAAEAQLQNFLEKGANDNVY